MGEKRYACRVFMGNREGKRRLGRRRHRWMILKKYDGLVSSGSGQGPGASSCEHDNEPSGSIKYWDILE
jgi:hypothetical protein